MKDHRMTYYQVTGAAAEKIKQSFCAPFRKMN